MELAIFLRYHWSVHPFLVANFDQDSIFAELEFNFSAHPVRHPKVLAPISRRFFIMSRLRFIVPA